MDAVRARTRHSRAIAAVDKQELPGAQASLEDAVAGVWAIAALGRLAESGTLGRLADSDATLVLEDEMELADARLLTAYGLLEADAHGYRVPPQASLTADASSALARAHLMQAIAHTRGQPAGWHSDDGAMLHAQGRASIRLARVIEHDLLPQMPEARDVLSAGGGSFLDVGVGVAALSIALAERFPEIHIVGLDVLPAALEIAGTQIAVAQMRDTIELRLQSVAAMTDENAFDLVWMPQMFIARDELEAGLARVWTALRPGGWIILALAGDADAGRIGAYQALLATTLGGGPMGVHEGAKLLERHRYSSLIHSDAVHPQPLLLAQRRR
jgi:SAM-dependent methyltransferase